MTGGQTGARDGMDNQDNLLVGSTELLPKRLSLINDGIHDVKMK